MSTDLSNCPICLRELKNEATYDMEFGTYSVDCELCGQFGCSNDADDILPKLDDADRVRLSGVVRERSERKSRDGSADDVVIARDNFTSYIANAPAPFDVAAKVQKLLGAVARRTKFPGQEVNCPDDTSHPLAYAADPNEWKYLTNYAADQGWLDRDRRDRSGNIQLQLTPAGWEEVQRRPRIESAQGFVAMWFDPSMDDAFNDGLRAAIEDDCSYRCRRVDSEEFNGDIVDEVMAQIRESRFVVCDVTGHRNGVYFEAGFAIGLEIPTIWTCRQDEARGTHFDAEHFNQIRWETPADLRKKLSTRIRATIGLGPLNASAKRST